MSDVSSESVPATLGSDSSGSTGARARRDALAAEIVAAAAAFLEEGGAIRDLTVDEVMARTTLARTNFYRVFADREELLLRVLDRAERELRAMTAQWLEGERPVEDDLEPALRGVAAAYVRHGAVYRAFAEASVMEDGVAAAWNGMLGAFIAATRARIEREAARGRAQVASAEGTARALVLMTEGFMRDACTHGQPDADAVVATLAPIWKAAILQSHAAA